jgi:shikimate kinase
MENRKISMENIVLIGMPGAGKSTVGVVLAKRLGYQFLDSDLVIQEHYGKLLQELIEEHGVEGFWDIEDEINASIKRKKTVITTGGSAVYGKNAMKHFQKTATIIYLQLPYAEIEERVGDLQTRGVTVRPGQNLWELYQERLPLYERYADLTIDCYRKSLREIVVEICERLQERTELSNQTKGRTKKADKASSKQDLMRNTEEELTDSSIEGKSTHIKKEPLKDKDIREPLFTFLEEYYGKMRIIEEKTMGKSRADVVMVLPDALYGIEIKSDADTYVRLADQIKDYDRYFDYNIIVVGTSHGEHVPEHVPAYWGIITVEIVDEKFDFYVLRKPLPNPKVKWKKKLELLWRPELAQLQEWNEMPKYKQLSKAKLFDKILERVPEKISEELLRAQVSELLFERDYSKVQEVLAEYRKGELEKQIEQETDPEERKRLMDELKQRQRIAKKNLGTRPRRRRRRKII